MARIPYPDIENSPEKIQDFFKKLGSNNQRILNVNKMMAYSSASVRELIRLGNRLIYRAELDNHLRELAIIRVSHLCGSKYEWAQHVPIALRSGVTRDQMEMIDQWQDSDLFSEEEKMVLRFTEEVVNENRASDITFKAASKFLNLHGLVELTISIGYWSMIAKFLNTFEVDIEEELLSSSGHLFPHHQPT
jgi:4-carboxymuconolactone decarboxylase